MKNTKEAFLAREVMLALANLEVCRRVCVLLQDYAERQLPSPRAEVKFFGAGSQPMIVGKNCGFFTTPVVTCGLMDIRRFVSFFGFKAIAGGKIGRRKIDTRDFDITALGLAYPSREELLSVLEEENVTAADLERAFTESLTYANKAIAHFAIDLEDEGIHFNFVILAALAIDKALRVLVFDALNLPCPDVPVRSPNT